MKIGILTFHCAHNYGAVLQCYALQKELELAGHFVEIIDYRPKYLIDPYKVLNFDIWGNNSFLFFLKKIVNNVLSFNTRKKRFLGFSNFIENKLYLTNKRFTKSSEIPSTFDAYIFGSDQIWSSKISNGFDSIYFAKFDFSKYGKKIISYAASMETKKLTNSEIYFLKEHLESFNSISVRENNLVKLIQPLTSKKVSFVLDPTLILDLNIWEQITKKPLINFKYVLVYQVRHDKKTMQFAKEIANQLNVKLIQLVADVSFKNMFNQNINQKATPEEFLGYFKYAECIVTTSFHGTAFSLIFKKDFYTIELEDGKNTRSSSLLTSINLEDRIIKSEINPSFSKVDYNQKNILLEERKKESISFLNSALEN